jgi:hypothetical protein
MGLEQPEGCGAPEFDPFDGLTSAYKMLAAHDGPNLERLIEHARAMGRRGRRADPMHVWFEAVAHLRLGRTGAAAEALAAAPEPARTDRDVRVLTRALALEIDFASGASTDASAEALRTVLGEGSPEAPRGSHAASPGLAAAGGCRPPRGS